MLGAGPTPNWCDRHETTDAGLHSHDWDTRASEALAEAKKLPPGLKRSEAIKKAGQLRVAADMKNLLAPTEFI
jgi:hypothetical protein